MLPVPPLPQRDRLTIGLSGDVWRLLSAYTVQRYTLRAELATDVYDDECIARQVINASRDKSTSTGRWRIHLSVGITNVCDR